MLLISDARKKKDIHIDKIKISLNDCEPTKLSAEELTKQLNDIGLYCEETKDEKLEQNIKDVTKKIGIGKLATFGVYKDKGVLKVENLPNDTLIKLKKNNVDTYNQMLGERFNKEADGSWEEGTAGQYTSELLTIQQKDNFDYLVSNANDFPYAVDEEPTMTATVATVDAIKEMFVKSALVCTAATVDGLDQATLEAVFSNALNGINESSFSSDYDVSNNRVITLLMNYDPESGSCDGLGIVTCEWRLRIKNYKEKKKNAKHETILDVNARSALYTDTETLDKHYQMVLGRNKMLNCILGSSISIVNEVEVFDTLPPATMDTFIKSVPCETDTEYADVMVFYASDVQKVGFVDNTMSEAESSYTKSITSGFMTESTVSFSTEINFEISAEVVKLGAKFGFNTSLTNQWSESQTETISIQVPAGKRAFLYQVTLLCARLRLNNKTGKYSYVEYGKFLTDAYKTTNDPLYENEI